jgi:hypothetical protein
MMGFRPSGKNRSKFLFPAILGLFFFAVMKYQDTAIFQSIMDFLFNPDAGLALPPIWQENRMLFMGGALLFLVMYYRPIWLSYKQLIRIYRESPETDEKPSQPILQSSYLYRQDKVLCLAAWVMDLCTRGTLTLSHTKGANPWSIGRGPARDLKPFDLQLVDTLFRNGETVRLKTSFSDPDPDVVEVAGLLYGNIKEHDHLSFRQKISTLPAWFVLVVFFVEIPFFIAAQGAKTPGTLIITLFSSAFAAVPVYVFCDQLPVFFSESRILAYLKFGAAFFFSLFAHWLLLTGPATASYWATGLYPGLVMAMIVAVYKVPLLPKNTVLLTGIIGYAKHLSSKGRLIREEDLPWTLGLGVYSDFIAEGFYYDGGTVPEWLSAPDEDVQPLMKRLHQTLPQQLSEAVYGEMDSKSRLTTSGSGWRY